MRFLTLSTTGIFNAIQPSLFPPIEGKETTTFLLALEFYVSDRSFPPDEEEDVEKARKSYDVERKRIRALVKALCNDWGKPIEELRTEIIKCLPEFISHGTYNGKPLLSEPRDGYYTILYILCIKAIEVGICYSQHMNLLKRKLSIYSIICLDTF